MATNATRSPGTTGCTADAQSTLATVSPVQTSVVKNPPPTTPPAAAGVVRRDDSPKSSGKKNVAPIIATE